MTSQFFANLYLDDLDHYIKQALGLRPYLRYVDDMVVLDDDKPKLAEIRAAVRERRSPSGCGSIPTRRMSRTQRIRLLTYSVTSSFPIVDACAVTTATTLCASYVLSLTPTPAVARIGRA